MKTFNQQKKTRILTDGTILLRIVKTAAELTDVNAHGEARKYIAECMGFEKLASVFHLINQLHDIDGHLLHELHAYRVVKAKELLTAIEKEYGTQVKDRINSAL